MKWFVRITLLSLLVAAPFVHAEEVEFPEEELARESVLPVFESRHDVLDRHVVTKGKFEAGAGGGLMIDEPFYNDTVFSGHLGYHFTELHGVTVDGLMWGQGASSYAQKIQADSRFNGWNALKAPHPQWGVLTNYEFTAYYGKISITKQTVMNLNLFAYAGLLYINMQSYNSFGGDIGIGQNFFITPSWAVRFDLRMLIYPGPNAAAVNLDSSNPNPAASSFPTRIFFDNQMLLSLVYLI